MRGHGDVTLGEGRNDASGPARRRGAGAGAPAPAPAAAQPASVRASTRAARSTSAKPTYSGVKPKRSTSGAR